MLGKGLVIEELVPPSDNDEVQSPPPPLELQQSPLQKINRKSSLMRSHLFGIFIVLNSYG